MQVYKPKDRINGTILPDPTMLYVVVFLLCFPPGPLYLLLLLSFNLSLFCSLFLSCSPVLPLFVSPPRWHSWTDALSPRTPRYLYRTSRSLSLRSFLLLSRCHMFASTPPKNAHSHNLFISIKYLHSHIQYTNTHTHIYKHCYLSHLSHFTAF